MACAALLPLAWAWADRDVGHEITYAWSGMPSLILKGERHTGTHWLSHVLRHNFAPEHQRLHVEPTIPDERCPFEQPFSEKSEVMCCWTSGRADDRCVYDTPPTVYVFLVRDPRASGRSGNPPRRASMASPC